MNKILLVDKEEGISSNALVNIIKRKFGLSKAGHAGTLDPFATGLVIVLCDEATKISNYLICNDKTYIGKIKLGTITDTLDKTGNVIETKNVPELSIETILECFKKFVGEIKQVPPMYSAIKIGGKKMYNEARKGNVHNLPPRDVVIKKLSLIEFDNNTITFKCECSKGTYIRSLARDIAQSLNTVGHLESLRRIKSGSFDIDQAKKIDQIDLSYGINILDCLDFRKVIAKGELVNKIKNGLQLKLDYNDQYIAIIDELSNLLAIYKRDNDIYKCERGFNL